jgi:NADH dehydrogenase [ubiquinone] 1 alpha subcomplex assembly factor 7
MTPLEKIIRELIVQNGPMPLDRFMALALGHPQHGYYMTRDPFGATGDFTTAPEISQIFGELIGVWVLQVWEQLGSPSHFALVELGPGRGTLMSDILRVLQKRPACAKAAAVQFVETSPTLRAAQQVRVPDATWHDTIASLPGLPTIIVANEFFDALPIRQFEWRGGQVLERVIGLEGDALTIGLVPTAYRMPFAGEGVFEDGSVRETIATSLGNHLATARGAALIIDYGHARSAMGDTLQAMKAHQFCAITNFIGEADITSHVDFENLARAFAQGGATIAGLMTQGQFLQNMGLEARTQMLQQNLGDDARKDLVAASDRLANAAQMGELFKVMAVTGGLASAPYPF